MFFVVVVWAVCFLYASLSSLNECCVLYGDACTTYPSYYGIRIEQSNRSAIEYEQEMKKKTYNNRSAPQNTAHSHFYAHTHVLLQHIMHHSRLREINRRWHTLLSLYKPTYVYIYYMMIYTYNTLNSASTIGTQQLAITAFKMKKKIDVIPVCSHFTLFIFCDVVFFPSSFAFALYYTFFVVLCVFNSTFPQVVFFLVIFAFLSISFSK